MGISVKRDHALKERASSDTYPYMLTLIANYVVFAAVLIIYGAQV